MNPLFRLCLVLAILCYSGTNCTKSYGHDLNELIAPEVLREVNLDIDELGQMFNQLMKNIEGNNHDLKACMDCNTSLTFGPILLKDPKTLQGFAHAICSKTGGYSSRVCEGTLKLMAEPLAHIFTYLKVTIPEMCAILLSPDCMTHYGQPYTKNVLWELPLPKPKPFTPKTGTDKPLKMLHLTDIHLDLSYTPGSNSTCGEPVCCRPDSPRDHDDRHTAGYWSQTMWSCDCPLNFADDSIKHMGDNHKDVDLVIWTGDNVPHDVWETSVEHNIAHIKAMTDALKKAFPNTPVFPCLGNHEPHPVNMYVPNALTVETQGKVSMGWLYDTLADDLWKQWIDTESAKKAFKKGGYFSKKFSDTLKVVVMNNNICQNENYYIAYDPIDPDGQLQWLIDELNSAETDGSYVMLLGHVPPADCYIAWSNNYFRIMERYQHLIVSSYFGHTHNDEIVVLYNKDHETNGTYAISHGYIGASLTAYNLLNPGYRIFTLDSNGKPLDWDIFYTNITDDNIKGKGVLPKWQSDTSAKQIYGMDSLSTESWDKFMTRAEKDDRLVELYINHYHRFSDDYIHEKTKSGEYNIKNKRDTLLNKRTLNPIYSLLPNNNK